MPDYGFGNASGVVVGDEDFDSAWAAAVDEIDVVFGSWHGMLGARSMEGGGGHTAN
jgi:hypothetical protein